MKKFLKILAVLAVIAAAIAVVYTFLKKKGYFSDCDMDCENCDADCACKEDPEDDFDEREYVSIQPKAEDDAEEEEKAEE